MPWAFFDRSGNATSIPKDPFIFWARLQKDKLLSTYDYTIVLWCFSHINLCFGASLLETETIQGNEISGMWRLVDGKLVFLKAVEESSFPELWGPNWLIHKTNETSHSSVSSTP